MSINAVRTSWTRAQASRLLPRARHLPSALRLATGTRRPDIFRHSWKHGRPHTTSAAMSTSVPPSIPQHVPLQPFKTHQPSSYPGSPRVHSFYDDPTATWTFLTADPVSRKAIVIDPVLDYEPSAGRISQKSVKGLAAFLQQERYTVVRICETHVHADHLTGAYALKNVSQYR